MGAFGKIGCACAVAFLSARPAIADNAADARRTSAKDLSVEVEKLQLANGLVVLLSRDATASSVLVDMTFRAGTIYEPPKRSGMAHFIEHLMMRGATPDTDYIGMLSPTRIIELNEALAVALDLRASTSGG